MLDTVVYLLSYLYFFVLWNNFHVHVPKVIGYVSVNWNIQSNTDIFLLYTYMAICFHWDVLQLSYFFLDLLDLDEEAGMIQKSTNQIDQNENAEEQANAESTNQTLMPGKYNVNIIIIIIFWIADSSSVNT